ncbi:protein phosphatase 2C domain-containing protein [Fibrella sp. HMF5335]|uniref:Protein phosphatase 2C domain-containing protein n=1 Tax=Fibrella rubiginis TaxID=2817060 RepID=A0A939GGG8_9BACT|nr:protein phosphatase 2C domain-containing protein [Fibrella rubiginis]MBO0936779.1 protein phosphatase 2C domain-containing protein [Fibrella rubiginis]
MNRVVSIYPPVGFTQQGRRDNNEDYIVPPVGRATHHDRFFVVCDGVGGAQRGEVASLIAGESLQRFAKQRPNAPVDSSFVREALLYIEAAFDRAIADEPEANLAGMSTTMTMLSLHDRGVTIAHVGDSRVYHVRDNQVLHQTDDHSLVNELVRTKQITLEEAANHPRRNVITRAIQGSANPTTATVYVTQDVAPDDYFFLCTDGVLECIDTTQLTDLLADTVHSDQDKVKSILACCADGSRDNYSGYLIRVADVAPLTTPLIPDDEAPMVAPVVAPTVQPMAEPVAVPMTMAVEPEPVDVAAPAPVATSWPVQSDIHELVDHASEPVVEYAAANGETNGPENATTDDSGGSFQLLAEGDSEADERWRQAENRNWFRRLFS